MEVETIPIICHHYVLSVGERKNINPRCVEKRSLGYENCSIYQNMSKTSKKSKKVYPTR